MNPIGEITVAAVAKALEQDHKPGAPARGNYDVHYPAICEWFSAHGPDSWNPSAIIQGSLMIYGWMPTIFEGRKSRDKLTADKLGRFGEALSTYAETPRELPLGWWNFVNGSFVGTSKFLHFWSPNDFGIWDMNVAVALVSDMAQAQALKRHHIEKEQIVKEYQAAMREVAGRKNGRTLRDIETVLFRIGRQRKPK